MKVSIGSSLVSPAPLTPLLSPRVRIPGNLTFRLSLLCLFSMPCVPQVPPLRPAHPRTASRLPGLQILASRSCHCPTHRWVESWVRASLHPCHPKSDFYLIYHHASLVPDFCLIPHLLELWDPKPALLPAPLPLTCQHCSRRRPMVSSELLFPGWTGWFVSCSKSL